MKALQARLGKSHPIGERHEPLQIRQGRHIAIEQTRNARLTCQHQGTLRPHRTARVSEQEVHAGQPGGGKFGRRRQGTAFVIEDHALASRIQNDGRDGAALSRRDLQPRHIHAFALKVRAKNLRGSVIAHRADKAHICAQACQGHRGIGRHATHPLVERMCRCFGGLRGKRFDAKHQVERHMAYAQHARPCSPR